MPRLQVGNFWHCLSHAGRFASEKTIRNGPAHIPSRAFFISRSQTHTAPLVSSGAVFVWRFLMITQGIEMLDLRTGCRMLRISMRSAHRHQANPNSDLPKFFHVGGRCFYERAAI